ncbi:Fc.00g057430.m01.CDS01 [Cosmosporella sp. VM-42]
MSYYDNPQWSPAATPQSNSSSNWDHQGSTTPVRAGASGPQPQDDYAFSYQFDEVDRAYENLQKSGKGYGMGGRHGRVPHGGGPRSHSVNNFDEARGPQGGPNLQNFYATQRHQPSRGSNEAEQVMQAKRRMAAQRERELRNLHTEQQYQRTVLSELSLPGNKHMSEEETRELIARQRSALYGEGPFAEKTGYVDETGAVRPGAPATSGPSSIRGHSPLAFDAVGRAPPSAEAATPGSVSDTNAAAGEPTSRPQSTTTTQTTAPTNKVFDNAVGGQSRTSNSSPTGASPPRDHAPGSKPAQSGSAVAPIGTRPSGTPATTTSSKRSTTPLASPGGWGRGNGVWGQSSGLGAPASVWG